MPDSAIELLDPPPAGEIGQVQPEEATGAAGEIIAADVLVEEISIDGMCGVY